MFTICLFVYIHGTALQVGTRNLAERKLAFLIKQKQSYKNTCPDWLKTVFLYLERNTELPRAVDVMMAQAKRIYNFDNQS